MSEATVTVQNIVAAVTVENVTSGASVDLASGSEPITIEISEMGIPGPPGPGGTLDPDFIIDGGNF